MAASLIDSQDIDTLQALGRHGALPRHACFPITQNRGKEGEKHEKILMCRPAAGHIQPWVCHQRSRNIRGGNTFTYLRNYDDLIMGKGLLASNQNSAENVNMQEYYDWLMPNKPNISYEDAYNLSQHYLQAMGIDLELHYSEPCTIVRQQVKKSVGWTFTFTRNCSGLQAQFLDGQWVYINPDAPPAAGAPWNQEVCIMAFDKDGLCKLWWQGAVSTSESKSVEVEEVEDIKKNIRQQLYQMYGTHKNGVGAGLDIVVERVELGISLIATNNLIHYGEYIPTWYVSYKYKWRSDKDIDNLWSAGQIMFSGVDGRYIAPRVFDSTIRSLKERRTNVATCKHIRQC